MFRNSHNLRGSFTHTGARAPRWRIVFIALVLALAIGSVGQAPPVKAQDEEYTFFVDVIDPSPITMCVGETTDYVVQILFSNTPVSDIYKLDIPEDPNQKPIVTLGAGATIKGSIANPNIGNFTTSTTMLINSPSPSSIRPGIVTFTFKAKETGDTSITFTADIAENGHTFKAQPSRPLEVKVIPCKYMVIAISSWSASYPGGSIKITANVYNAYLKMDAEGSFRGTGDVVYIATESVPNCGAVSSFGLSTINLGGYIRSDALNVQLDYKPTKFSDTVSCPQGSGSSKGKVSAAKLNFTVPIAGGTARLDQEITGGPGGAEGSVDVYIIPLTDNK